MGLRSEIFSGNIPGNISNDKKIIAHFSFLISHFSLLITHYSLLITHYSLSIAQAVYFSIL